MKPKRRENDAKIEKITTNESKATIIAFLLFLERVRRISIICNIIVKLELINIIKNRTYYSIIIQIRQHLFSYKSRYEKFAYFNVSIQNH
jgi:hypothetical protein